MTSVFFYRLKVKTTPGKGETKLGVKKIVFDHLCENGLERTTKTIPVGIFADITFFTPFRGLKVGGEKIVSNFLCENGLERTTKTIPVGIFADLTFFTPFRGLKVGAEKNCF